MSLMKSRIARLLRKLGLRKLASWLDPEPTATTQGGGGTGPRQ